MENQDKKYTVYQHINKINRKKYVGITNRDPEIRWGKDGSGYLRKNKKGKYNQPAFARAILKYGWDNFIHEIIAKNLSEDEASQMEYELIEKFELRNPKNGYNCAYGGRIHPKTEDEKKKISESNKEFYKTHEHHMKGTHLSKETKKRLSDIFKNRIFSEETKKKMSQNHYDANGKNNPRARKVRCIETGEVFDTAKEAGLKYNKCPSNPRCGIRDCCRGRRKTSGIGEDGQPLHWEWAD